MARGRTIHRRTDPLAIYRATVRRRDKVVPANVAVAVAFPAVATSGLAEMARKEANGVLPDLPLKVGGADHVSSNSQLPFLVGPT